MKEKVMTYEILKEDVECPYCKHKNQHCFESKDKHKFKIVNCDADEGGCDESFIVSFSHKIEINHETLEIEGQGVN